MTALVFQALIPVWPEHLDACWVCDLWHVHTERCDVIIKEQNHTSVCDTFNLTYWRRILAEQWHHPGIQLSCKPPIWLFIHWLPFYPVRGRGGAGAYPNVMGRRQGTSWTSRQFIIGLTCRDEKPFTFTFTPTGNLESPINRPPAYMFLDCGRKPEDPE